MAEAQLQGATLANGELIGARLASAFRQPPIGAWGVLSGRLVLAELLRFQGSDNGLTPGSFCRPRVCPCCAFQQNPRQGQHGSENSNSLYVTRVEESGMHLVWLERMLHEDCTNPFMIASTSTAKFIVATCSVLIAEMKCKDSRHLEGVGRWSPKFSRGSCPLRAPEIQVA